MLARDQNLLLQPEVNPSVGLRYLNRSVQLAAAWRKLGGYATVIHGSLPGRLLRQLEETPIELLTLASAERVVATWKPGWLFVDGARSQLAIDCSCVPSKNFDQRWKLATTSEWAEAHGTRFQSPDLLLSPDDAALSPRLLSEGRVLRGARYRMRETGGALQGFQAEATTIPSVARKILIWARDESSEPALAEMLADVMEVVSDRTTVDVVASVKVRDSAEIVRLKKANPEIRIRFWSSVERRCQSMAPVHLAIVDSEAKSRILTSRGMPVFNTDSGGGSERTLGRSGSTKLKTLLSTEDRATFRSSLSRLIRNRDRRQSLIDLKSGDRSEQTSEQAADRIARSLATAGLRLEPATVGDWSEVSRWQCDPESLASALPCGNRDAQAGRSEFATALNRPTSPRWMFRLSCGTPIGMASLDPYESIGVGSARVQVLIKPTFRNQGYGTALLERVLEHVEVDGDVRQVIFQTRSNDQAARRLAGKAGLLPVAPTVIAGVVAHQFGIELKSASGPAIERPAMQRSA